jgi:hypothetical protein
VSFVLGWWLSSARQAAADQGSNHKLLDQSSRHITTEHPGLKGVSFTTVFYMEMYVVLALLRSNMSIAHCAAGFSEPAVGMTWLINCD